MSMEISASDRERRTKNGIAAAVGAAGTVAAGVAFAKYGLGLNPVFKDSLLWGGATLAAGGATTQAYLYKRSDFVGNGIKNGRQAAWGVLAGGLAMMALSLPVDRRAGEQQATPSLPSTPTEVEPTNTSEGSSSPETSPPTGQCEIIDNIPRGDRSEAVINDVKKLQTFLVQEGYYTAAVDGVAGNQTRDAIDQLQQAVGADFSQPWNLETCLKTPFGDGDPATPALG